MSKPHLIIGVAVAMTIVSVIFTVGRQYVQMKMKRKRFRSADFFNILAMLVAFVILGLLLEAVNYGFGRKIAILEPASASFSLSLFHLSGVFMILQETFNKISICLSVKAICLFGDDTTLCGILKKKTIFWISVVIFTLINLAWAISMWLQCTPVEFNWPKVVAGHCLSNKTVNIIGIVQGVVSITANIIMWLVSSAIVWNSNMRPSFKRHICGILLTILGGALITIVRMCLFYTGPASKAGTDATWDLAGSYLMLRLFELTCGSIVAACNSFTPLYIVRSVSAEFGYELKHSASSVV